MQLQCDQDLVADLSTEERSLQQASEDTTKSAAAVGTRNQQEESEQRVASPALSTGFSDADTARHTRSGSSRFSKLIESCPQSCLKSMNISMAKQPPAKPFLKIVVPTLVQEQPNRSFEPVIPAETGEVGQELDMRSTTSSPVDPSYDPSTQRFRTANSSVCNPGEISSFLDLDSSSDEETPTVQQAIHGRVGKPRVIRNSSLYAQGWKQDKERETENQTEKEGIIWPWPIEDDDENKKSVYGSTSISSNRAETLAKLEGIELETCKQGPWAPHVALPAVNKDRADGRFSFSKTPIDYVKLTPISKLEKALLHYSIHSTTTTAAAAASVPTASVQAPIPKQSSSWIIDIPNSTPATSVGAAAAAAALHLTLTLARHPSAVRKISIAMSDLSPCSSFDDHTLFTAIRRAYHKQLVSAPKSILIPRTLTHATIDTIDNNGNNGNEEYKGNETPDKWLDGSNFVAHLLNPSLGRNLSDWLNWLCRQQQQHKQNQDHGQNPQPPPGKYHRFRRGHGHCQGPIITLHYSFNLPAIALAVLAVFLTAAATTVVWVLFGPPGLHAHPHAHPHATTPVTASAAVVTVVVPPTLTPTTTTSTTTTATNTNRRLVPVPVPAYQGLGSDLDLDLDLGIGIWSSIVEQGGQVPGAAASSSSPLPSPSSSSSSPSSSSSWHSDAQKRVLTALVLGLCVFVGGILLVCLWIWAGWLLL